MFKQQTNIAIDQQSTKQKERLDEILKSIDGLIFSIKMNSYQSAASGKTGNGSRTMETTAQEMLVKKDILFNLLPREELYALTKRKSSVQPGNYLPMN